MTMTFYVEAYHHDGVNVSNVNARAILEWLGYSAENPWDLRLPVADFAARCRRRLWPEARNVDPGIPGHEEYGCQGARVIDCGRSEGYLTMRVEQLLALAQEAGPDGWIVVG